MPVLGPVYLNGLSRRDEIKIHRLRIGHTRKTQGYLMEGIAAPYCVPCNDGSLYTVKHILIECPSLAGIRWNHYAARNMKDLFERVPLRHIIGFLREANLYDEI